ncbi:sensor domain-containing diguanylate cyclase [Herbaspirillum autotrophicum]|uniref:sensor domain-containing diguanylate cyclase n=1 Tax=Herbaspirillum autotrophicum TaxID=180195 RepID=UPI00067D5C0F|nr:GGDEF domain-containing protein [Herbaspirillum autotrophicum]
MEQKSAALFAVIAIAVMAGSVKLIADTPLGISIKFVPAFAASMLVLNLVTAALLMNLGYFFKSTGSLLLGGVFLIRAIGIIPHFLSFPTTLETVTGQSPITAWYWIAWHAEFALGLIFYALAADRAAHWKELTVVDIAAIATSFVLVCMVTLYLCSPWLPTLLRSGDFQEPVHSLTAKLLVILHVLLYLTALTLVVVRMRPFTIVQLWLTVCLVGLAIDAALGLSWSGRFTLGWYFGRALNILTSLVMLLVLMAEAVRLFRQTADANHDLHHKASHDALTGLYNRRSLDLGLELAWRQSHRDHKPLSLALIDIDNFKLFNDTYGHPAGDQCLQNVSKVLQQFARRPGDMAVRYGGEEFVLLLTGASETDAALTLEQFRQAICDLELPHRNNPGKIVTVSIGIASSRPLTYAGNALDLISAADKALYRAKHAGRNAIRAA